MAASRPGFQVVGARGRDATVAVRGRDVAAVRAYDLARLPAAREIIARRSWADLAAGRVVGDFVPAAILLGVAVTGEDLDQV
jgi:hypothetical protein